MGACDFTATAWGNTPGEAFNEARTSAQHEHGHGGYSGTIAEKHGVQMFTLPPRLKASKLIDWVMEAEDNLPVDFLEHELAYAQRAVSDAPKGKKRAAQAQLAQAKKRLAASRKQNERFARKVGTHLDLVVRMHAVWTDKWGPACGIEITSPAERKVYARYKPQPKRGMKLYVFLGMASS